MECLSKKYVNLCDLNTELLLTILNFLGYSGIINRSSVIDVKNATGSILIRKLCQSVGGSIYVSGEGGKNYMDMNDFAQHDIKVFFHQCNIQPYKQSFPDLGFMGDLSIVDLLYNHGKNSVEYIKQWGALCEPSLL